MLRVWRERKTCTIEAEWIGQGDNQETHLQFIILNLNVFDLFLWILTAVVTHTSFGTWHKLLSIVFSVWPNFLTCYLLWPFFFFFFNMLYPTCLLSCFEVIFNMQTAEKDKNMESVRTKKYTWVEFSNSWKVFGEEESWMKNF